MRNLGILVAPLTSIALIGSVISVPEAHGSPLDQPGVDPQQLHSPPGWGFRYTEWDCKRDSHREARTDDPRSSFSTRKRDVVAGVVPRRLDAENQQPKYSAWGEVWGWTGRVVTSTEFSMTLTNNSSEDLDVTFTRKHPGAEGMFGHYAAPEIPQKFVPYTETVTIEAHSSATVVYDEDLLHQPGQADIYWWVFDVDVPKLSDGSEPQTLLSSTLVVDSSPWAMEDDSCQPLIPSNPKRSILADGTPHDTGIVISPRLTGETPAASDIERLHGTAFRSVENGRGRDEIEDADVTIDESGRVSVTLPKGFVAEGSLDDEKKDPIFVEFVSDPREQDAITNDRYRESMVLHDGRQAGYVNTASNPYVGAVSLRRHYPFYEESDVRRGTEVYVPQWGGISTGTSFKLSAGSPGIDWNPRFDENGGLTLDIPGDAGLGEQEIRVDLTYPDGSVDKGIPVLINVFAGPVYPDVTYKPGQKFAITPSNDGVPEGTEYELEGLGDWEGYVDENGFIVATVPRDARDGDRKELRVKAIYPNGEEQLIPVTVNVRDKSSLWWLLLIPATGLVAHVISKLIDAPTQPAPSPQPAPTLVPAPAPEKEEKPLPVDAPREKITAVPSGATVLGGDVKAFI